jgi:glyoxylase I family protein
MNQIAAIETQGIHHVSINVKDVDTALTFYIELLNLELLERPDLGFPGAWIRAGEQEIHLLGIDSGEPVKEQHFAFAVNDAQAIHAALQANGYSPTDIRDIPNVCRQFFTHDPSGNMVEFNQRL